MGVKVTGSEWYILECLWQKEPKTLMQIATELKERQGWARSTCATMLKRMEEKGLITYKGQGRTKYFYARIEREEVVRKETKDFLERVYHGSISMMMSTLVEKNELSEKDIEELETILEKLKK